MLTNTGLLKVLPKSAKLLVNDNTPETQSFMVFDCGNQRMGPATMNPLERIPSSVMSFNS